ncbi:heptosyltransferase [Cellvibrio zantedeschiae]|uniref:Heptosyltransferase n=1 Tax=Cellvibrio zantedeschiae TaxID=1237077 RepID=A0ABQ3AQB4_9GAMM|nr:glycosyltransferase family 9 protein [Cellvibrio zantedeschiae]GGY64431.1 heptosyltransferase [Cellvibrio zantedeschiae]
MSSSNSIKKILVIRFRRVGDAVLGTSLCTSLRKTFPQAEIHYLLNTPIAPLYEGHPDIDKVITFDNRDDKSFFRYLGRAWSIVRANKYDVIIDMRGTVRTLLFSFLSPGTRFRIGTKKGYSFLALNHAVDNRGDKTSNMIDHNLEFLKPLEQVAEVKYCRDFRLYVTESEKQHFCSYMQESGVDFARPVMLAVVSARLQHKVWDKERMKQVLQRIIDQYDAQIIFNFVNAEREFAINVHQEMNNHHNIFTNIEANSLRDLCALSANCDFFFGNEGGARHLAQALDVPSFAIFPPKISKSRWLPAQGERFAGISPDDFYSRAQQKNMTYEARFNLITVERVWEMLKPMLDRYLKK